MISNVICALSLCTTFVALINLQITEIQALNNQNLITTTASTTKATEKSIITSNATEVAPERTTMAINSDLATTTTTAATTCSDIDENCTVSNVTIKQSQPKTTTMPKSTESKNKDKSKASANKFRVSKRETCTCNLMVNRVIFLNINRPFYYYSCEHNMLIAVMIWTVLIFFSLYF